MKDKDLEKKRQEILSILSELSPISRMDLLAEIAKDILDKSNPLQEIGYIQEKGKASETDEESESQTIMNIIDNLISNGIKYNKPDGSIAIIFEDKKLKISDTGIGIDTKNLFHIFDKYYQENSLSSGVGLGLNIVKKYCDENKLGIKIDSKKDEGTTFILDLKNIIKEKSGS